MISFISLDDTTALQTTHDHIETFHITPDLDLSGTLKTQP